MSNFAPNENSWPSAKSVFPLNSIFLPNVCVPADRSWPDANFVPLPNVFAPWNVWTANELKSCPSENLAPVANTFCPTNFWMADWKSALAPKVLAAPKSIPSSPKICTRSLFMSVTNVCVELVVIPLTLSNWPSPVPDEPNLFKKLPEGSNFWMRLLPVSVTKMFPPESNSIPIGLLNWLLPFPFEPNWDW